MAATSPRTVDTPDFVVEHLDPATLTASPLNFRRHPSAQISALDASISEHGWLAAPIINRHGGKQRILDGHARVELAVRDGLSAIPCRVIDVPEEQERRILRVFDAVGALAEEDTAALDALIAEIDDAGLEQLLASVEEGRIIEAPEEFPEADENLPTEYCCPKCLYSWSGKPR